MNNKFHKVFLSLFFVAAITFCAYGQETSQIESLQEPAKDIDTHLANRQKLIKYCMETFATPLDMESGDQEKIMAAYEEQRIALDTLRKLRAVEAAPLLASMITYNIPGGEPSNPTFANRMFGCVPTLVDIGKPGAVACLKRIVNLTEQDLENEMDVTMLVLVIFRVEGEKMTRQIFDDFKTGLKDEQQIKNIEKATILIDAARDLDGIVQDGYSKLIQETNNK